MIAGFKPYPSMKNSGVSWLGQVPSHWTVSRLKQRLVRNDSGVWGDEDSSGTVVVRSTEQTLDGGWRIDNPARIRLSSDQRAGALLQYGDLVVTKSSGSQAHIGKTSVVSPAIAELGCCFSNFMQRLRPNRLTDPRFLWYLLNCPLGREQLVFQSTTTTGLGNLNGTILGECRFAFPPPSEQVGVVRFLDHADRRIRRYIGAKQKLIKLLEEQKQAIIQRAVTRGLDSNVRLKSSGIEWLGDVPQDWDVKRLRHISPRIGVGLVVNPSTYFVDESTLDSVPMLLGNNVIPGGFNLQNVRRISLASNDVLQASRLNVGDVVVVRVGAPGVAAVVPAELDRSNCASVMIVRRSPSYISEWLAIAFNSPMVRNQVDAVKYGAAQKQFNISHAVNFWFAVPSVEEQSRIVDFLHKMTRPSETAIATATKEIELLREYRTRLIADVVTGRFDVREAAQLTEHMNEPDEADEVDTEADVEGTSDELDALAAEAEA